MKNNSKLIDTLLIFFSAGCLLITVDSIWRGNFYQNYWVLMCALGSFYYFTYRKQQRKKDNQDQEK
jgi:hypothetical protein